MKVYAGMDPRCSLTEAIAHAQRVERLGYDGLHVAETVHDSLAVALLVAEHTERITVRTSVTLAFTRSPTLLAYAAWDLSKMSGGRFQLGSRHPDPPEHRGPLRRPLRRRSDRPPG